MPLFCSCLLVSIRMKKPGSRYDGVFTAKYGCCVGLFGCVGLVIWRQLCCLVTVFASNFYIWLHVTDAFQELS